MYKNIRVPVALEHERDTGAAMDVAHQLLDDGGRITALHVMEAIPGYATQYLPEGYNTSRHDEMLAALKAELGGVKDVKPEVISGNAGRAIVDYATDHDVDCIVVASHRPGLQDYLLGSTAARVVRHAVCAVHVLR